MPTNAPTGLRERSLDQLFDLHRDARRRRDSAPLGGEEYRAAAEEIAHLEAEVSRRTALPGTQLEEAPGAQPGMERSAAEGQRAAAEAGNKPTTPGTKAAPASQGAVPGSDPDRETRDSAGSNPQP